MQFKPMPRAIPITCRAGRRHRQAAAVLDAEVLNTALHNPESHLPNNDLLKRQNEFYWLRFLHFCLALPSCRLLLMLGAIGTNF